jgi:hypothetical protein
VLVTLTLTCAIWLTQSLRFIELIVNRGLSIGTFLYLTLLLLPSFLWLMLPISSRRGAVHLQPLATDSELVVMRSAGLGRWRGAAALAVALGAPRRPTRSRFYFLPLPTAASRTRVRRPQRLLRAAAARGRVHHRRAGITVTCARASRRATSSASWSMTAASRRSR